MKMFQKFLPDLMHMLLRVLIIILAFKSSICDNYSSKNQTIAQFKLAFLFLTRGPMPMEPLWRRFFAWNTDATQYNIYIHPPPGFSYPVHSIFHGKEIQNRSNVHWGSFGIIAAEVRLCYRSRHLCADTHLFTLTEKVAAECSCRFYESNVLPTL